MARRAAPEPSKSEPATPKPERSGLRGLALVVQSGGYDRVHYALAMASAAAAIDRPVILFFTGRALWALVDQDGWRALDFAEDGSSADTRDALLAHRGVATLPELLEACGELGVRIIACEMGWRALGVDKPRLRPDLAVEGAGLVTLYNAVQPDWQMVYV